jgi:hypothetical protein
LTKLTLIFQSDWESLKRCFCYECSSSSVENDADSPVAWGRIGETLGIYSREEYSLVQSCVGMAYYRISQISKCDSRLLGRLGYSAA